MPPGLQPRRDCNPGVTASRGQALAAVPHMCPRTMARPSNSKALDPVLERGQTPPRPPSKACQPSLRLSSDPYLPRSGPGQTHSPHTPSALRTRGGKERRSGQALAVGPLAVPVPSAPRPPALSCSLCRVQQHRNTLPLRTQHPAASSLPQTPEEQGGAEGATGGGWGCPAALELPPLPQHPASLEQTSAFHLLSK